MGQRNGSNLKIAKMESGARFKDLPVDTLGEFRLHCIGGIAVRKDRKVRASGETPYTLGVVVVFVSQEDRLDLVSGFADRFKHLINAFSAKAGVDENLCLSGAE
jgi:hypothetical protein